MDQDTKKTVLRMIPYGLYVLTGENKEGEVAAATINWVTQTAFSPPLIVAGVKADSGAHSVIKSAGHFALNMLGKEQSAAAYAFFKPSKKVDGKINGEAVRPGSTGAPIMENAPAYVECKLVETIEKGDHSIFIGEVVDAGLKDAIEGRPDDVTLTLKDLGEKVFYGG